MSQEVKHYLSAFWETILIVLFTVMPTIFIYFSIKLDAESTKTISDFYKSGEFFLYGVSFSSSAFLIYHARKRDRIYFPLILILLSSIAYSVTLSAKKVNVDVITNWSIFAFFVSLIVFYFAQVLSNKHSSIDVRDYRQNEQNTIQDGLN
ncbi:hypothetical protein [Flavobacterium johnsoniae]|uniref:hypothetical protein n=1 Tax=Flavobacterium johnsoniae TaxID=986 RepID=UPI0011ED0343|nr:hypothetical protein [Flavobacterium johnsoniae]